LSDDVIGRGVELTVLLCDYAEAVQGKLYIAGGGWSELRGSGPADLALAVKMALPWTDADRPVPLEAVLLTEDGQRVEADGKPVQFNAEVQASRPPDVPPGTPLDVAVAIRFGNLLLPPGGYRFDMSVDGTLSATVPFRVRL
jgi:hypothetical protein